PPPGPRNKPEPNISRSYGIPPSVKVTMGAIAKCCEIQLKETRNRNKFTIIYKPNKKLKL
ncbi:hypothetical protein O5202_26485, partial [Escherichia coli]|nr:hypothetical protein [Escherichia coli]